MVLSEDVQRAAFEGDLETITAWMASNDVNDTVVATPHRFNANSRSTLLKLIVKRATNAGVSQVSVLPLARAVIARGADLELSNSGCPPLHLAAESRGYESVAMCSLLIEAGADVNQKAYESKTPRDFVPAARRPCCRILERVLKHALLPAAREASRPRESRPRDHGGQAACLVVRAAAPALSHRPLVLACFTFVVLLATYSMNYN